MMHKVVSTHERIIFMGTGDALGMPRIGCDCTPCSVAKMSTDVRVKRNQTSLFLQQPGGNLLVDAGTSVQSSFSNIASRYPMLDLAFNELFITHHHFDHMYGLPYIEHYAKLNGKTISVHLSEEDLQVGIVQRMPWLEKYPKLQFDLIKEGRPFTMMKRTVVPFQLEHGNFRSHGFRMGDIAYLPDMTAVPASAAEIIAGARILILECTQKLAHPEHTSYEQAMRLLDKFSPEQAFFVHMSHDYLIYPNKELTAGEPYFAFDGLVLDRNDKGLFKMKR